MPKNQILDVNGRDAMVVADKVTVVDHDTVVVRARHDTEGELAAIVKRKPTEEIRQESAGQ